MFFKTSFLIIFILYFLTIIMIIIIIIIIMIIMIIIIIVIIIIIMTIIVITMILLLIIIVNHFSAVSRILVQVFLNLCLSKHKNITRNIEIKHYRFCSEMKNICFYFIFN